MRINPFRVDSFFLISGLELLNVVFGSLLIGMEGLAFNGSPVFNEQIN